jgi:hypothetical protein
MVKYVVVTYPQYILQRRLWDYSLNNQDTGRFQRGTVFYFGVTAVSKQNGGHQLTIGKFTMIHYIY